MVTSQSCKQNCNGDDAFRRKEQNDEAPWL